MPTNRNLFRALIVDDEEVVRNGLSKSDCFPKAGYCVIGSAADGQQAIELSHQLQPDIIITDINMPVMDGLSFISSLRKSGINTEILILSCYDDFSFAQKAIQLKVSSYLLKPFTDNDLINALESAKQILIEKKKKRHIVEMEQFVIQEKESVLLNLLRQVILRGSREAIIQNILHFGLMPSASMYGLIYCHEITFVAQDALQKYIFQRQESCYLIESSQGSCVVLVCCYRHSDLGNFAEDLYSMRNEICENLYISPKTTCTSDPFTTLTQANSQFLKLQKQIKANLLQKNEYDSKNARPEIQRAIEYIHDNLCEERLCLNLVADEIYMSPFYFSRLFNHEIGMSFVKYVNTHRIGKACEMLKTGKFKVYEISKAIGFQNETYFNQVFKSIKGVTPKKFQQESD